MSLGTEAVEVQRFSSVTLPARWVAGPIFETLDQTVYGGEEK